MKFKFCYDGYMLDIEPETEADIKLLDGLQGRPAQLFLNAKFKTDKFKKGRRAMIIVFPETTGTGDSFL